MDVVDISTVTSTGDNKRRLNKKNKDWHKQIHLRKTAVQPPTMQSEDKRGPKKIIGELEQSTVLPSSKKPPQEAQQGQHGTDDGGNTLRFTCSQCKDNLEYVPKDLVRHFEEKHRGSPPVFSCHVCSFSTCELSFLQVHLLSHKDTFSSCSICNDNIQRTWPEFSEHLTVCHCKNGKYSCEMCPKFSTGDVSVFLEHTHAHNLGLDEANDDLSLCINDKKKFGSKTTAQTFGCQHCGYESSQKLLINKHIKAVHVCQHSNQKKRKKGVHSIAMTPNDPIPKVKPRLTRSAVKEMCWLTQDCLSLPGREFLDKYCHLSDPHTTLEETQQFLMKSVAGETGDQKWTKALKTVLSNVPQDMNLNPKSENGIVSNSSDLTVLTVKNKITVAQNGATYAKRLKMMTSADKEAVFPESAADALCVVDQNGCLSNMNDLTACPQTETRLNNDILMSAQNEPSACIQMQENRENQEFKTDQDIEEHGREHEEPVPEDEISSELKSMNEIEQQTPVPKVLAKKRRRNRRRKRKNRSKKVDDGSTGQGLKIVLKKNPVKEKQWVSQSSLSPSGSPQTTMGETVQILQNKLLTEAHQEKWTKPSNADLLDASEAITPQSKPKEEPTHSCAARPVRSKNMEGNTPVVLQGVLPTHQEIRNDADVSLAEVEMCPQNAQLQTPSSDTGSLVSDDKMTSDADGGTPHSSFTKCLPVSQPVITAQGEKTSEDLSLALSTEESEQSAEAIRYGKVPADSCPDLHSDTNLPAGKAIQQEPSPAAGHQQYLVPKNLERTLKLVAINPSQLVKRPAGDQPVVVLNHPDADIPEVTKIMEVVNRYRGEVQKVILSQRTMNALSAMNGEVPETNDPTDPQSDYAEHGKNSVQERFLLKFKLRRVSRKKYEVVGVDSPSRDSLAKFRCWFCGRAFASQEMWMVHRQRHLMEWKRPNCENSNVAHTG